MGTAAARRNAKLTDQFELITRICIRPQQFAWFIGAGTSAVAGLPTAWDIIWDLKRRYYRREENQSVSRQDLQVPAIKARIQSYMLSKGFPVEGDPEEYTTYFQKIFGDNKELQRKYIHATLSEENVTLSVGNRVLGALLATGRTNAVFTTNFDSVVERAVAEVSGRSLAAYQLEGGKSANVALSNDEFPFYCKLHGDFRYDSIRNLQSDLAAQDEDLSKALINAANRFGFIVAGYSGRDKSVMTLLRSALKSHNPFPHGLFWTGMKGAPILPSVTELICDANDAGVNASFIQVETFDAFMLRLWRNIDDKDPAIDAKVKKSHHSPVSIPLPNPGTGSIVRFNALPIVDLPSECLSISFKSPKEWRDLRSATGATEGQLMFTKADTILCWGQEAVVRAHFNDVNSVSSYSITEKILEIDRHLYIKGFLEEALCRALARDRLLLTRSNKSGSFLIIDSQSEELGRFSKLHDAVGKPFGQIAGLFAPIDEEHPLPQKVHWAEALRISIDFVDGRSWLLLQPDVWIWPPRARKDAADFLDQRRGDRYNNLHNTLLDAWLAVLFGTNERAPVVTVNALATGRAPENPSFSIGTRTAYAQRLIV